MATATKKHKGKAAVKRLSEHRIGGVFYGFKSMIGGKRFYFFRDFGITTDSDADAARANDAAAIYRREWQRLLASGFDAWTPDAEARAKSTARAALLGIALAPAAPAPTPTDTPSAAATPASGDGKPAIGGCTLHQAIDLYSAKRAEDLAIKEISETTARGDGWRLKGIKTALADRPLSGVGYDELRAMVGHFKKRPVTRFGTPMKAYTIIGTLAVMRQMFQWAKTSGRWTPFVDWEETFEFDAGKVLTDDEEEAANAGPKQYSLDELGTLYANATPRTRLYMLLGLNCAMGQREISTLKKRHCKKPGVIERKRNKTGVLARWSLWSETAAALSYEMLADELTAADALAGDAFGESKAEPVTNPYRRTTAAPDVDKLALVTEDGYPLLHGNTDSIGLAWNRLMDNRAVKEAKVRRQGFYALRRTAVQMVRDIAGYETHKIFGAWSTVDPSGRKGVSEKHYTERTQADFDKVAAALVLMRQKLQPMFDAKPAEKAKTGPKPKPKPKAEAVAVKVVAPIIGRRGRYPKELATI